MSPVDRVSLGDALCLALLALLVGLLAVSLPEALAGLVG